MLTLSQRDAEESNTLFSIIWGWEMKVDLTRISSKLREDKEFEEEEKAHINTDQ